jgi:glycine/D-amino acid oxidase-like deaminating enzyme/nitrite reductase/ring-hydroxylating ferredoxin subunit
MREQTPSFWLETTPKTNFPKLEKPLRVDVVIVGGGITGITAALLLKRAGKKVVVLEQARIGSGETGHTTAHITEVLDSRYHSLISDFGEKGARLAARSVRVANDRIAQFVIEEKIECQFKKVPGFLYAEAGQDVAVLKKELEALNKMGIPAKWISELKLPFPIEGGIEVEDQAQFHPQHYLVALAQQITGDGSYIFENTRALVMKEGVKSPGSKRCRVDTDHAYVEADEMVIAAHCPSPAQVFLQTKVAAYRSYAIGVILKEDSDVSGLFWDIADPYHYLRNHSGVWIVGGEDHKTGMKANTEECFDSLKQYAQRHFSVQSIPYRWSGQILESVDGLPFIGPNSASNHTFVATGFSGNGITFGTLAGMLISDQILGIQNSWSDLYNPKRIKPLASVLDYVNENKDFPICLLKDRFTSPEASSLVDIKKGEGKTLEVKGERVAVYRDTENQVHAVSAVCTHLGCFVHFNGAEKTWDCPCHGSRFAIDGDVINGPATLGLKSVEVPRQPRWMKSAEEENKAEPGPTPKILTQKENYKKKKYSA